MVNSDNLEDIKVKYNISNFNISKELHRLQINMDKDSINHLAYYHI